MVIKTRLMRTEWRPRPHDMQHAWNHGLETGVVNQTTIYPICMYDEGLGTPSAYESHPENAAFVAAAEPNCFVNSRVDKISCILSFALTKAAIETDKVKIVRVAFMPIFMAFKEDYIAIDELTSIETQDVLEMQTEAPDRQGFPLYNTVKLVEKFTGSAVLAANVPGLT